MSSDRLRRTPIAAALGSVLAAPRVSPTHLLAACGALAGIAGAAGAQLPVPCAGGACGAAAFANTVSGRPSATWSATGAHGVVQQTAPRAILNWQSFNVGQGHHVEFRQPDSASVALNRIHQQAPSQIFGRLSANGQVWLINQNGIVFGAGAQVNVHSLVASSLTVSDQDFINGILGPINELGGGRPVLTPFRDGAGVIQPSGMIRIEPGAVIQSASGGRVMVFAPQVENRGEIRTPDGQTILGAGNHVYLQASQDPNLRGLLVEVDTQGDVNGAVRNLGTIVAERGNTTLIGLAVNQQGRVSATTSVSANGSVRLLARSGAEVNPNLAQSPQVRVASRTGDLTLAVGSVTEVVPDLADTDTTVRSNLYDAGGRLVSPSRVELMGDRVLLESGAAVVAPSGDVRVTALKDPRLYNEVDNRLTGPTRTDSRIYLAPGSRIDVSGTEAVLPMERNQLSVELRGTELRDKPVQRDGILRGRTITIDVRKGTQLADVQAAIDGIPVGVAERSVIGGSVALKSEGDLITSAGSRIDASGGRVRFLDGYIATTQLISGGRIYDVSDTSRTAADRVYEAFAGTYTVEWPTGSPPRSSASDRPTIAQTWTTNDTARSRGQFHAGYVEGRDAGTIELQGHGVVLAGDLVAQRSVGPFQSDAKTLPQAGRLVVGASDQADLTGGTPANFRIPDVSLVARAAAAAVAAGEPLPNDLALELGTEAIRAGGFGRIAIYSNGRIRQDPAAPLDVPAGGSVVLIGREVDIAGSIRARAGSITLASRSILGEPLGASHLVSLAPSTLLDARGLWINQTASASGPAMPMLVDGGNVSISSIGETSLPAGSRIDVSSGGSVDASGRLVRDAANGNRPEGDGGTVSLQITPGHAFGADVRAGAVGKGGTLLVTANAVTLGDRPAAPGELVLPGDFLQRGGFGAATLTALDAAQILPGTQVDLRAHNLLPDASFVGRPSGAELDTFATLGLQPDVSRRAPATFALNLTSAFGPAAAPLDVGTGARIVTDPRGEVRLQSSSRLALDGAIVAPGGRVALEISTPSQANDPGFWSAQSIFLGPGAQIDASGVLVPRVNARGLDTGSVLAGGEVTLNANRGYVVVRPRSPLPGGGATPPSISVAGAVATLDVPNGASFDFDTPVGSAAGSVTIASGEGIVLDGRVALAPGLPQNAGGALALTMRRGTLAVARGETPQASAGLVPGAPVPDAFNGLAVIGDAAIAASAADQILLTSAGRIELAAGSALAARRSVILEAPVVAVSGAGAEPARVAAAYVALGNTVAGLQTPAPAPSGGAGVLAVRGEALVDLIGNVAVQGADRIEVASGGDVRMRGVLGTEANASRLTGSLSVTGTLALSAAQAYPTTLSEFALDARSDAARGVAGRVEVSGQGSAGAVLSAGGTLTVRADTIDQGGVLKAPHGAVALAAGSTLTLSANSVTSVAGDGQAVPFGLTQNQRDWFYDLNGVLRRFEQAPEKAVTLSAPAVRVDPGAVVDVRGGGDLRAWEFVPGPGGSTDVLANLTTPAAGSGEQPRAMTLTLGGRAYRFFAILPGATSVPHDVQSYAGSDLRPGEAVYLSGLPDLPAGTYPLLPARYALLPGARLVAAVDGFQDIRTPAKLARDVDVDVVPGYRTALGTSIAESRFSGYAVLRPTAAPGGIAIDRLAEYRTSLASSFFPGRAEAQGAAAPRVPGDAGRLAITNLSSLALDGQVLTAGDGGRGARIDIAADHLSVVAAPATPDGTVQVDAARLSGFGAESVVLGATRRDGADGVELSVGANTVSVRAGARLEAPEVILAARDAVTVESGAEVVATGAGSADGPRLQLGSGAAADGALLRAASGGQATIERTAPARVRGELLVADGARVAGRSLAFDATRRVGVGGTLSATGSVLFGADRISVGEVAGLAGDGLLLSSARLAGELGIGRGETVANGVREVILRATGRIDLIGTVDLSNPGVLAGVVLDAPDLRGVAAASGAADARVAAGTITLAATQGAGTGGGSGTGTLALDAGRILIDGGAQRVSGFGAVEAIARERVDVRADGSLATPGLTLTTPLVTAASGVTHALHAAGPLVVTSTAGAPPAVAEGAGARLELAGTHVRLAGDARVELPSGVVTLRATGTAPSDGVTLADRATVSTAALARSIFDQPIALPGGTVVLSANAGAVAVGANARVDVSGAAAGGAGGRIAIDSPVTATLSGALSGAGGSDARGGVFELTSGAVPSLSTIAAALAQGGFNDEISVRARTGALDLDAGAALIAQRVKLTADAGAISLAGGARIDASAPEGGRVDLSARDNVTLASGAAITAAATGGGKRGGRVTLATTAGSLALAAGSVVDVSGGAGGPGGDVLLRAPRTGGGAGSGVAITSLAGAITGAERVSVEGFKTYDAASIGASQISEAASPAGSWFNEARTFMGHAATIEQTLGRAADPSFRVMPGVEVRSSGDLTLATDWSLHRWRYDGETGALVTNAVDLSRGFVERPNAGGGTRRVPLVPGVLTLRAGQDLLVNQSLSDGFAGAGVTSTFNDGGSSWSYRLTAGADLTSADPLALRPTAALPAGKGSLVIAAGTPPLPTTGGGSGNAPQAVRQVRTGDGSIEVAAGRDVLLRSQQSLIYTAGRMDQRRNATPSAPNSTAVYSSGGGDLELTAQGSIVAARLPNDAANQLFTAWLHREGSGTLPASWWVDFRYFQQGVGALGGGDVRVRAGGNVENLSVSIPTNRIGTETVARGGGDLDLRAGGDVLSGAYFVARGRGTVEAGGEIGFKRTIALTPTLFEPVYPIVALQDGTIALTARKAVTLETAINPTVVVQSVEQSTAARSFFYSYGENAGVSLTSLAGDVTVSNNPVVMERAIALGRARTGVNVAFGEDRQALFVYPPALTATAPEGSVVVRRDFTLFPAARGQLALVAGEDVRVGDATINLSDTDPAGLPRVAAPTAAYAADVGRRLNPRSQPVFTHATVPVHAHPDLPDREPTRILAARGDIAGGTFYLNEQAHLRAGRDVADVALFGQNVSAADTTLVTAGRDVVFTTPRDARNAPQSNADTLEVAGPGRLEVRAGRHVDLGSSAGIVTTGNLKNPALPVRGADITVIAGAPDAPAYADLIARYLPLYTPGSEALASLTASLRTTRQAPALTEADVLAELVADPFALRNDLFFNEVVLSARAASDVLARRGELAASGEDPIRAYQDALARGRAAVRNLFPATTHAADLLALFDQVGDGAVTGRAQAIYPGAFASDPPPGAAPRPAFDPSTALARTMWRTRGAAGGSVDSAWVRGLFQEAPAAGDLSLFFSQIRTLSGGDIDLLVPWGGINAGVAAAPGGFSKTPNELGIVAQDAGRVRVATCCDFTVNQSRVFTLRGGDLIIWTPDGRVDAGKGAKSALSTPPPTLLVDNNGNVSFRIQGAASGSGIRILLTRKGDAAGGLSITADEIDAGEAGIGSAGTATFVTTTLRGGENISVSGGSNLPPPDTSGLASGLSSLGASTAEATRSSEQATRTAAASQTSSQASQQAFRTYFLTVEVIGFGD